MALPSVIPVGPTAGEKIGEALGTGVSSGIQALVNMKLQQMQKRQESARTAQGLQALFPDMPQQQLSALAQLDPQSLGIYLKEKIAQPRRLEFGRALQQRMGVPMQQQTGQLSGALQPIMQQGGQAMPGMQPSIQGLPQQMQQGFQTPLELTEQQATNLANIDLKLRKEEREARQFEREFERKTGVAQAKELGESYKSHKKELETNIATGKEAGKTINTIDRLLLLNKAGKLNIGQYEQTLEKLGLDKFFSNPETDEARSAIAGLKLRRVKSLGTNRFSNMLLEIEGNMLPALWNTRDGFTNTLESLKADEQADLIRGKITKKVMNKYEARKEAYPRNINAIIEDKASSHLEKIAINGLQRLVERMDAHGTPLLPDAKKMPGYRIAMKGFPDVIWKSENGRWIPERKEEEL